MELAARQPKQKVADRRIDLKKRHIRMNIQQGYDRTDVVFQFSQYI